MTFLSIQQNPMYQVIIVFLLIVCIFFLCREIICWYYKVNERNNLLRELLDKQEQTNQLLSKIAESLDKDK